MLTAAEAGPGFIVDSDLVPGVLLPGRDLSIAPACQRTLAGAAPGESGRPIPKPGYLQWRANPHFANELHPRVAKADSPPTCRRLKFSKRGNTASAENKVASLCHHQK
jgi:hypothetical protein